MSHWARGPHTAGPLLILSMRNWIPTLSVRSPINPPKASMSRTIWPLATPPTAGLQLMRPMAFTSIVSMAVLTPSFQAAWVASIPACPPPTTTTSKEVIYLAAAGAAGLASVLAGATAGVSTLAVSTAGASTFHSTGFPFKSSAISFFSSSFSRSKAA